MKMYSEDFPGKTFIAFSSTPYPESAPVPTKSAPVNLDFLRSQLSDELLNEIDNLKVKSKPEDIQKLIHRLCSRRAYHLSELSTLIGRTPKYTLRKFIQPMMNTQIEYLYKDMVNHPDQAYVTISR